MTTRVRLTYVRSERTYVSYDHCTGKCKKKTESCRDNAEGNLIEINFFSSKATGLLPAVLKGSKVSSSFPHSVNSQNSAVNGKTNFCY